MKKLIPIVAVVGFAVLVTFSFAAKYGGYVEFSDNANGTFHYLTPGAGMTGESDTSQPIFFPEDLRGVTWYSDADSGAADADMDTLCFKLYGITPYGTYVFLDTIGGGIGAGGHYADAAVDSTITPQFYSDTCWHYKTVYTDSAAASPTPIHVDGLGWLDKFTEFRLIFSCTDTTDLGASIKYIYTTYGLTAEPSF